MPPWCTCLFCIAWLGNVQRFIMRAKPLQDSLLNPFICDVFAAVVVCARSLHAVVVCKKSRCRLISVLFCDLNLEVIGKFQTNNYRLPHWKKNVPFAHGNFRIFDRMVSAHGLRRAYRKTVFLARSSDNKSASLLT